MSESYSAHAPRQSSGAITADAPGRPSSIPQRPRGRPWLMLVPVVLGMALHGLFYTPLEMLPSSALMPLYMTIMFGPMVCVGLLALLWLFAGRASWLTRIGSIIALAGLAVGAVTLADPDTRFWFTVWGVPAALGAMTFVLVLLYPAPAASRIGLAALVGIAALVPWEMIRMEGVTGTFGMNPAWRWTLTGEQMVAKHAAEVDNQPGQDIGRVEPLPVKVAEGDWPGFRGPVRDGRAPALHSLALSEKWRRPVGPGWGSVSGVGDWLFTQEQRGAEEMVLCYDLKTGKPLWSHSEETRHKDDPSGPGPRATPTFHEGKVYSQGATGRLVCLDATTGKPDWMVDTMKLLDVKASAFGYSGSPLVHAGKVFIHPGVKGPLLVAFDAKTGSLLWQVGSEENESYSSPQLATLGGVEQILVFSSVGLAGHDVESGKELWRWDWSAEATAQPCVQPTLLPGDRIIVGGASPGAGMRCVKVKKTGDDWSADLAWETTRVTPRFNDIVVHEGNLYGIDTGWVFCVDAETGDLRWKGGRGRYGSGQLMLAGDTLVVVSEKGQLSLLAAETGKYPTPTAIEALKDKTWNHPAIVRGHVLVRNSKELICFEAK